MFGIDPSEANRTGTLTLSIEKGDPPRLRRLEFRWVVTDEGDRFVGTRVITYSDWGETDVQRPDWAGYSALELLLDLIDYDP